MTVTQILFWMAVGAAALFAAHFALLVVKKGWGWALAKIEAWWTADKAAIASDIASLKTDMTAVKTKLGL